MSPLVRLSNFKTPAAPVRNPKANALAVLVLMGAVSFLLLISPLAGTTSVKAVFLAVPGLVLGLLLLLDLEIGLVVWVLGMTLLITQTGYQFDIGYFRSSALELMIVAPLPLLALTYRRAGQQPDLPRLHLPG